MIRDKYYWHTKILDAEYNHSPASLDGVFKARENLHGEEHYQLKILLQNMNTFHLVDGKLV
jgi:hypothetical protein